MALKKEQFLVGQPKAAPKAPKSKINSTLGTLTPGGRANRGSHVILPAKRSGAGIPATKMRGRYPNN
jgi:hypothetical protein